MMKFGKGSPSAEKKVCSPPSKRKPGANIVIGSPTAYQKKDGNEVLMKLAREEQQQATPQLSPPKATRKKNRRSVKGTYPK